MKYRRKTSYWRSFCEQIFYFVLLYLSAVSCTVNFQIRLVEESSTGITVGDLSIYTPDYGNFTLEQTDYSSYFSYHQQTGIIKTAKNIDRDLLSGVCVNESEFGTLLFRSPTKLISGKVFVKDINDNKPKFPSTSITRVVPEESVVGYSVQLPTATDNDCGLNGSIHSYTLQPIDKNCPFALQTSSDRRTLSLQLEKELDREIQDGYYFNITACDTGQPPQCTTIGLNITIADYNDNTPVFHNVPTSISVEEQCNGGSNVTKLNITDADDGRNAEVSLKIKNVFHSKATTSEKLHGLFQVDSNTAEFKVIKCLIYDKDHPFYTVIIEAADHGSPVLRNDITIQVNVVDINDHCPVLFSLLFLPIKENEKNDNIGVITATDGDDGKNGEVDLEITSGNGGNIFYLQEITKEHFYLKVNTTFNREITPFHYLTVNANDHGIPPCSKSLNITIPITDVNDNQPWCKVSRNVISIPESAPIGTYVTLIDASDDDIGNNGRLTYSIVSKKHHNMFQIVGSTGLIVTNGELDFETIASVEITVKVSDHGSPPLASTCSFNVTITDINDNQPQFTKNVYEVRLAEDVPVDYKVIQLTATDRDEGNNSMLTFAFLFPSHHVETMFAINSDTGIIRTKSLLDREIYPFYYFIVMVKDNGDPQLSSTAMVKITVLNVIGNMLVFYPSSYYVNLYFNQTMGFIVNVTASYKDYDKDGPIAYRFKSKYQRFHIDSKTGTVTSDSLLDSSEEYTLDIIAYDNHGISTSTTLYITIITENDVGPQFEEDVYMFDIEETVPRGTFVGKVPVRNNIMLFGEVSYAISDGDLQHVFVINDLGEIRTSKKLLNNKRDYMLHVMVKTNTSKLLIGWTKVDVIIQDINNNAPMFTNQFNVITINDTIPVNSTIYTATTQDPDLGSGGIVQYQLLNDDSEDYFGIGLYSGDIFVAKSLKPSLRQSHIIKISATDMGLPKLSSFWYVMINIISVNVIPPLFASNCTLIPVARNSPTNQIFLTITATDPDCGQHGKVFYHLAATGNKMGLFGIFPNGSLFVRKSLEDTTQKDIQLSILASDTGRPQLTSSATVNIFLYDATPSPQLFINNTFVFDIYENEQPGKLVGKLDNLVRREQFSLTLIKDYPNFSFNNNTYEIRTRTSIDREQMTDSCFTLYLQASHVSESFIEMATILIRVRDRNDNKPSFPSSKYVINMKEDEKPGTAIFKLTVIDVDQNENSKVNFSIINSSTVGCFSVTNEGDLVLIKSFKDTNVTYTNLTVQATNIAEPYYISTCLVEVMIHDVNNNAPQFITVSDVLNITEDFVLGKTFYQVKASDQDIGRNSLLTYDIAAGNLENVFKVDHRNGKVSLLRKLDKEKQDQFELNITVTDSGMLPKSSSQQIIINVIDVNDNPPIFTQCANINVSENIGVGKTIGKCLAVDKDSGENGKVKYRILREWPPGGYFKIDQENGDLSVVKMLDFESYKSHQIIVSAVDQALPVSQRFNTQITIVVYLQDVNDNSPILSSALAVEFVPTAEVGDHVTTITARDLDAGNNGKVTFLKNDGEDACYFEVGSNGKITVDQKPDVQRLYRLNVTIRDFGQPTRETSQMLIFFPTGSNGLSFKQARYFVSVVENAPPRKDIVKVSTASITKGIEYFITKDTSHGQVVINRDTGVITAKTQLDREAEYGSEINVTVSAVDTNSNSYKTASVDVHITILDINDNAPIFSQGEYLIDIRESYKYNNEILTLVASDKDDGKNGSVSFSFFNSNVDNVLRLDGVSGKVYLLTELDYESKREYVVNVTAKDDGTPAQYSWILLIINVLDVNDNAPLFTATNYSFTVMENSPIGARLGSVHASDEDTGRNGKIVYTLSGKDAALFKINIHSGLLVTKAVFDREDVSVYVIEVIASDLGEPTQLSSNAVIYISILDENDNNPVFRNKQPIIVNITEDIPIKSPIITLQANDDDFGLNAQLVYFLSGGNHDNAFFILPNGTVLTALTLDRETRSYYDLQATVSDSNPNPWKRRSVTAIIHVNVVDVNDETPYFDSPGVIHLREDQEVGKTFSIIRAVDKDNGLNGEIMYDLQGGVVAESTFQIDPYTGALSLKVMIDRETQISGYINITVEAKDRGQKPKYWRREIMIIIDDVNDNRPIFQSHTREIEVYENTTIGTELFQLTATDKDQGRNGMVEYMVIAGDSDKVFQIHPIDGIITLVNTIDRETETEYKFIVEAYDLGTPRLNSNTTIHVKILDVNDNYPEFQAVDVEEHVKENVDFDRDLYQFIATDMDEGENGQITYSIVDAQYTPFVRIENKTGVVSVVSLLDRETKSSYLIVIMAKDHGNPQLYSLAYLTIIIDDENDNSPVFVDDDIKVSIYENSTVGSVLCVMNATDADHGANGRITYDLVNDFSQFRIDSQSGTITTVADLDREIHGSDFKLVVKAIDNGKPQNQVFGHVTVCVLDVDDNKAMFESTTYKAFIQKYSPPGTFVTVVHAIDKDQGINETAFYALTTHKNLFHIEENTGIIFTDRTLPSSVKEWKVQVQALNRRTKMEEDKTTVVVTSSTVAFPVFNIPHKVFNISENADTGYFILHAQASGNPVFHLVSGNDDKQFNLDFVSRDLTLKRKLDHERKTSYSLWLKASLNTVYSSYFNIKIFVIDENDNKPTFEKSSYRLLLKESDVPNVKVAQIIANDPDSGQFGLVEYTIQSAWIKNWFRIDKRSGIIYTLKKIDREQNSSFNFTIQAEDKGKPFNKNYVDVHIRIVDVNDEWPVFNTIFPVHIREDTQPRVFLTRVHAQDKDENSKLDYSLSKVAKKIFSINSTNGKVFLEGRLDRETFPNYTLTVAVSDGKHVTKASLYVSVQDVDDNVPKFVKSKYSATLPELSPKGSVVCNVHVKDDDIGPNAAALYTFQRTSVSDMFRINSKGTITITKVLKFNTVHNQNEYNLTVVANNPSHPKAITKTLVNVMITDANDHEPIFETIQYSAYVPSVSKKGEMVLTVKANDFYDTGVNSEIIYKAVSGNGSNIFNVIPNTGVITVAQNLENLEGVLYFLEIQATDRGIPPQKAKTAAKVFIRITAKNKYDPVFEKDLYETRISENYPIGTEILRVKATDRDPGVNGDIVYDILLGEQSGYFTIDQFTGSIKLATKQLDYEERTSYSFNIQVSDRGHPVRRGKATVMINVTDYNDNPPKFHRSLYEATVAENTPIGHPVLIVQATDRDTIGNTITYTLSGTDQKAFKINPKTGVITTAVNVDYERKNEYQLIVLAKDDGEPRRTSDCNVIVRISGINEFVPRFSTTLYSFKIKENSPIGAIVGQVIAADDDKGYDGVIQYMFVDSSKNRYFNINQTTGEILVTNLLDSETTNNISLTVLARNPGEQSVTVDNTDKARVVVSIEDTNDPPRFLQQLIDVVINEDTKVGTQVGNFSAVDDDTKPGFDSPFTYKILKGNTDNTFRLLNDGGFAIIETNKQLDRERKDFYNLTIAAVDDTSPSLYGTATLLVQLRDVNDNAPILKPGICPAKVKEHQNIGTVVLLFDAVDKDIDPNKDPYTFEIMNKERVPFTIDGSNLKTTVALDREKTAAYDLKIKVQDSGHPKKSYVDTCRIIVDDINDNQPSSETRKVTINIPTGFKNDVIVGDVSPIDADQINNYKCEIQSNHQDIFSFQLGTCILRTKKPRRQFYILSVKAHDELYTGFYNLNIAFNEISDITQQNSVILRLPGVSIGHFLETIQSIQCKSGYNQQVLSIQDAGQSHVQALIAYFKNDIYIPRNQLLDLLKQCKSLFKTQMGASDISIDYNTCSTSSPCIHGDCIPSVHLLVNNRTTLTSKTNVFLSVYHQLKTSCRCQSGFTGDLCEFSTKACSSKPCRNGGTCVSAENGFKCVCRKDYTGKLCETLLNLCDENPCRRNSQCISTAQGAKCRCDFGGRGERCEFSSIGFYPLSYMTYSRVTHEKFFNLSLQFATVKQNALILLNIDEKTTDKFVALEVYGSKLRFVQRVGKEVFRIEAKNHASDGQWHSVKAWRTNQGAHLSVDGDLYTTGVSPDTTSTTNRGLNKMLYLGGVPNLDLIFLTNGDVMSHDFVGCMRDIYLSGTELDFNNTVGKRRVVDECPRITEQKCGHCEKGSECIDGWFTELCECRQGNCEQATEQITITEGSVLEFKFDQSFLREDEFQKRIEALTNRRKRSIQNVETLSMRMRSRTTNAFLWRAEDSIGNYTELQLRDGFVGLFFGTIGVKYHEMLVSVPHIEPGAWLNVTLSRDVTTNTMTLFVDSSRNKTSVDQPFLFFGGTWLFGDSGTSRKSNLSFQGCLSHIKINDELLSVNITNKYGVLTIRRGKLTGGCEPPDFCSSKPCPGESICVNEWETYRCVAALQTDNSLSVGVIAAIVFVIILIIGIIVAGIAFKKRRVFNQFGIKNKVGSDQDNSGASSSSDSISKRKTPSRHSLDSGVEIHNTNTSVSPGNSINQANVITLGSPDEYTIVTSRRDSGSDQRDTGFTDSECEYGLTNRGANIPMSILSSNVNPTTHASLPTRKSRSKRSAMLNYREKVPYLINRGYLKDTRCPSQSTAPSEEQESIEMQNYSNDIEDAENYSIGDASLATYSDLNFPNNPRTIDSDRQRYRPSLERFSESDDSITEQHLSNINLTLEDDLEGGGISSSSSDGGFTISEYDEEQTPCYETQEPLRGKDGCILKQKKRAGSFDNIDNESSVDELKDIVKIDRRNNSIRNTRLAIAELDGEEIV